MKFPWQKKSEPSEEELLAELKRETAEMQGQPLSQQPAQKPPLPHPAIKKPAAPVPMPSAPKKPVPGLPPLPPPKAPAQEEKTPMLTSQEVAKLPLFMKVEEYDRIVSDVKTLAESFKKMEEILGNLTKLEQSQKAETDSWKEQLRITKEQIKKLLEHMPESGKVKNIIEEHKKHQQKERFKEEVSGLQKDLKKVSEPSRKKPEQLSMEIKDLHSNISAVQAEMRALHEEIRSMAELARKKAEEEKKKKQEPHGFPKPEYKKTESKRPW